MAALPQAGMGSDIAISAEHLVRTFGQFTAVNDISFRVKKGEIFGFLGPNGSGKTTVIKMLTGLLPLSGGAAQVEGLDVRTHAEEVRERIGYMSQKFSLYDDLTVAENLTFYGRIYSLPADRLAAHRGNHRAEWAWSLSGSPGGETFRRLEAAVGAGLRDAA
jgi:ABC-2 type transport system ATP-binding protein